MTKITRKKGSRFFSCLMLVFGLITVFPQISTAQNNVTASGTIIDEKGQPMIGVNVSVKGTGKGIITDIDGKFTIQTDAKSSIVFSFIGYQKQELIASLLKNRIVTMIEDAKYLDEIVVVGYGTQKKKELTGAVENVKGEDLQKVSSGDLASALQGRIAGVNVQASTGAPGDESNILIRGVSSIQGTNSPLYIVDGIPYDSDPKLSPYEIASIDVLKDAASAAVYGSRGANGVILITTKQGKAGEMKVSINSYYGFQKITSNLPLMGTEDYLYAQTILSLNSGNTTLKDNVFLSTQNYTKFLLNNTNWMSELQVDNAPVQSHSVQIMGGVNNLTYSFTGGYFSQDGSLINSGYNRYNMRANINYKKDKWNIQTSLSFNTDTKKNAPWNLIYRAIAMYPYSQGLSDTNLNDVLNVASTTEGVSVGAQINSLKGKDYTTTDNFNGNVKISYNFTNNLSLSIMGGAVYGNGRRTQISPLFYYIDNSTGKTVQGQPISSLSYTSTRNVNLINENVLNYKYDHNDHHLNFTGLFSLQRTTYDMFLASRTNLVSNDLITLDATTGDATVSGNATARDIVSTMGRLQYNYKSRYLFSASVRGDASSRFSANNRWGVFPSFMGGWNVSEEPFWESMSKTFNTLKIRASYGETGSQNFADYITSPVLTTNQDYALGKESSDVLLVGTTQTAFTNVNVKWETSITKNIGLDLGFFKNALTFTADYYITDKKDMLFPVRLPDSSGAQSDTGGDATVTMNVGDMTNKGIELSASYKYSHRDFSFGVSANFSANRNVVTNSASTTLYLSSGAPVSITGANDYVTVVKEGYPVGAFFLIPTEGVIKTSEQLAAYKTATGKTNAQLGDLIYKDTNGDGQITDADRIYYGSGAPDFEYGLNLNIGYKGFDLSTLWYASLGNKIINGTKIYAYTMQTHRDIAYQWSTANPNSDIPAARTASHDNNRAYSDYWIEDGSFVRLREITFGYTFPKKLTKYIKVSKFRIYLSAQNPLTFTRYTGFDPEVGNDGVGSRGVDKGNYPVSSQYKAGLQLDF